MSKSELKDEIKRLDRAYASAEVHGSALVVLEVLEELTHAWRLMRLQDVQREQERVFNPPQDHLPKPF